MNVGSHAQTTLFQGIHQCGCADGLECRVTKEFDILGQKIQIRQCMESGVRTAVEKLEEEEVSELASEREKRFLIDVRTVSTLLRSLSIVLLMSSDTTLSILSVQLY